MPASGREDTAAEVTGGIALLYGLQVIDEELYREYRRRMTPLLEAHGGSFGVDVRVAEVLRSPAQEPINRLFTIQFPSLERREAFFANPEYQEVRRQFFAPAVASAVSLGRYAVL